MAHGLEVKCEKKIHHFLWKCINNSLPVKGNLRTRGLQGCTACSLCGEDNETVEHVLFACPKARETWKLSPVSWDGLQNQTDSFKYWWLTLARANKGECWKERLEISAYIFRQIWKARNAWHFRKEDTPALMISSRAVSEWNEFSEVLAMKEAKEVQRQVQQAPDT